MNNQQLLNWLSQYANSYPSSCVTKPLLMGILNVTPDSFSDGGRYLDVDSAVRQARKMIAAGADIIDIGGESSKPGAIPVSAAQEIERVIPVIERIRQESEICLSIDTSKASVMRAAVAAGANLINDISALAGEDSLMLATELAVPVCLMHMHGTPVNMQENPYYSTDVVDEINQFFQAQVERCMAAGIARERLILDPGFGFGKSVQHNLWLTRNIASFKNQGLPILLGVSRKSTLGVVLNKKADERLIGSIAVLVFASLNGVAIIRTHDVDESNQALLMIEAITQANKE